jgi:glycosyltransferase involved in cell wall biosynthesis
MACGLPVVCTDVGSIRLLLDPEWIIPVNPDKVVVKEANIRLDLLSKNPELAHKLGQRNRERISKYFSWQKNMSLWDEIFTALGSKNYNKIKEISTTFTKQFEELEPELKK